MEQQRRHFYSQTKAELMSLQKTREREQEILEGLARLRISPEVLSQKKAELEDSIITRDIQIEELTTKMTEIDLGYYDEKLQEDSKEQRTILEAKQTSMKKKKDERKVEGEKNKVKFGLKQKENNEEKQKNRDYRYFYKQFCAIESTLPDYMRENLSKMTSSKGYIFRGCWFFGSMPDHHARPSDRWRGKPGDEPLIMFEKVKGVLRIHEIHRHEHLVFEKKGQEKKRLILRKPRTIRKQLRR